jgi:hypothetical protein
LWSFGIREHSTDSKLALCVDNIEVIVLISQLIKDVLDVQVGINFIILTKY